jgi:hypothetical protein
VGRRTRRAKASRADAIAANVRPEAVSAEYPTARAAAEAAAHATSAVAAQSRAAGQGPAEASRAVALGSDEQGRALARRQGHAGPAEAAEGLGREDGLQRLEPAARPPADATAAVDELDAVSQAARNFTLLG